MLSAQGETCGRCCQCQQQQPVLASVWGRSHRGCMTAHPQRDEQQSCGNCVVMLTANKTGLHKASLIRYTTVTLPAAGAVSSLLLSIVARSTGSATGRMMHCSVSARSSSARQIWAARQSRRQLRRPACSYTGERHLLHCSLHVCRMACTRSTPAPSCCLFIHRRATCPQNIAHCTCGVVSQLLFWYGLYQIHTCESNELWKSGCALVVTSSTQLHAASSQDGVCFLWACVVLCCRSVEQASARFYAELRRHFYTTPKSYLDLISLYLQLLQERK